jgi:hypothetical protein
MSLLHSVHRFGLMARDVPRFLKPPITLEQAKATLRDRLRNRAANFLTIAERGIFGYRRSPYLPLLKRAGCELGDLRQMVQSRGLETTLRRLRDAGVFITYEEFKCRQPIVRGGQVFHVRPEDFDNPYVTSHYEGQSGGTTGRATRVPVNLAHLAGQAPLLMVALEAYGVLRAPAAVWRGILPDASGFNNIARLALCGNPPERWFSQLAARDVRLTRLKTDIGSKMLVVTGRLAGVRLPWPETVPVERADIVARWAADTLRTRGTCLILTQVSRALRVCLAAREMNVSLEGATFMVGGEPPTPNKVGQIVATGARCFPAYAFSEAGGRVGAGCARPVGPNDLHVDADAFVVYTSPRTIPLIGETVPALYFTSLRPTAPKVMLNAENDDYGVIETRSCGCALEDAGFTEHVRDIRSFSKLTGEGVTLVGSEMIAILEGVLPRRFGGSALDYQLLEDEDERGFTRLSLLVSPHLDIRDDQQVLDVMWDALRASSVGADLARDMWRRAGSLRVQRSAPIWTERGKLMPLHLASRSQPRHTPEGGP